MVGLIEKFGLGFFGKKPKKVRTPESKRKQKATMKATWARKKAEKEAAKNVVLEPVPVKCPDCPPQVSEEILCSKCGKVGMVSYDTERCGNPNCEPITILRELVCPECWLEDKRDLENHPADKKEV